MQSTMLHLSAQFLPCEIGHYTSQEHPTFIAFTNKDHNMSVNP